MSKKTQQKDRQSLLWLNHVIGRKRYNVLLLVLLQSAMSLIALLYAWLYRDLIDSAVAGNYASMRNATIVLLGTLTAQLLIRAAQRYVEEDGRSGIENRLKSHLFSSLLTKDYSSVAAIHSGEWMNRLTSDTKVVAEQTIAILPGLTGMVIRMAGAIVMLLVLEPRFAVVIVPGGAALLALTFAFRKVLKGLHKEIQSQDGKLRIFLTERLQSLMVLRAFGREDQSEAEAGEYMAAHKAARMRRNVFSILCNIGFGAAMGGAYAVSGIYCAWGIYHGTMSFGTLTAVMQLVQQVQNPFANISGYLPKYYSMIASTERLMEVERFEDDVSEAEIRERDEMVRGVDEKPAGAGAAVVGDSPVGKSAAGAAAVAGESAKVGAAVAGDSPVGKLAAGAAAVAGESAKVGAAVAGDSPVGKSAAAGAADEVSGLERFYRERFAGMGLLGASFTYQPPVQEIEQKPEMPIVLKNLSLDIGKGEYVAFTGPSGCGKSTVLKLLMCLYPLDEGRRYMRLTGGDSGAGQVDLTSAWRGLFAYVPQGNHLMNGTIREIVAFGDREGARDEDKMRRALHIACADEFVADLEQGVDTLLGERGAGLSEGQMQRVAIARAVFSGHPVLLLDEATSSLDAATERRLLERLRTMTDRTVVIVTHRPAALEFCDKTIEFGR